MDVLNGSTHKTMPGPQKGLALTNRAHIWDRLQATMPYHVSNPHANAVGALAITFAEMMPCRRDYARAIKKNARSLASSLHDRGFSVAGAKFGFTETQQVWIEPSQGVDAIAWGHALKDAYVRSTVVPLPSTGLPGIRIGVQELTRIGMDDLAMERVADILARRLIDQVPAEIIRSEVAELVRGYTEVQFVNTSPMPRSA